MIKKLNFNQKVEFIFDENLNHKKIDKLNLKIYSKIFLYVDYNLSKSSKLFIKKVTKINKNICLKYLKPGENLKDLEKFGNEVNYLIENNCSKNDLLMVIGGGTLIDLISFTASVFMRGIDLILVPTNLISMADASTAGKTCININKYKNLVGTIFLPKKVYININFLETCDESSLRQGWSEIFKYGLLGSNRLVNMTLEFFKNKNKKLLKSIITETIKIRIKLMKFNQLASNLGHTFGHAFEKITNNKLSHGDAVSIGTVYALKFAQDKKLISNKKVNDILGLMKSLNLKMKLKNKPDTNKILSFMLKDKKSKGDKIGLVLIKDIGKPIRPKNKPFFYCNKKDMKNFLEKKI